MTEEKKRLMLMSQRNPHLKRLPAVSVAVALSVAVQ